jgi:hypothetical protein
LPRSQKPLDQARRNARKRLLQRMILYLASQDKGRYAEDRVEEALRLIQERGFPLKFKRTKKWSSEDLHGVDFRIWVDGRPSYHFAIDVKSSEYGVAMFEEKKGHYAFLVHEGSTTDQIAKGILEMLWLKEVLGVH